MPSVYHCLLSGMNSVMSKMEVSLFLPSRSFCSSGKSNKIFLGETKVCMHQEQVCGESKGPKWRVFVFTSTHQSSPSQSHHLHPTVQAEKIAVVLNFSWPSHPAFTQSTSPVSWNTLFWIYPLLFYSPSQSNLYSSLAWTTAIAP